MIWYLWYWCIAAAEGDANVIDDAAAPPEAEVQGQVQDRNVDQNSANQPPRRKRLPKAWFLSIQVGITLQNVSTFTESPNVLYFTNRVFPYSQYRSIRPFAIQSIHLIWPLTLDTHYTDSLCQNNP